MGALAAAVLVSTVTGCDPGGLAAGGTASGQTVTSDETVAGGHIAPDQPGAATEAPTSEMAPVSPAGEPAGPSSPDPTELPADDPADIPVEPGTGGPAEPASAGQDAPSEPAVAAAIPAGPRTSTGGSGGSYTDQQRQAYTAGNGIAGRYLLYAGGIDPSRPVGLVVYVDGTGEFGVDNPDSSYALGGSSGLVAVGRARNMITLAVESPNQACECWHTGDTSGYADFLAELIETQLVDYPITEVWLAGFSSGAQEITRFLVPQHPELMRLGGGWVVFGGGGPPAGGTSLTAAQMSDVRGHWYTGTADNAVPLTASWGAQAGERWYAGRGVVTSHEWPAGVGHGLEGRLGQTVARLIDE